MKTPKHLCTKTRLLCAVVLGLTCFNATATAQTFTVLKSFGNLTDISGTAPQSQLVQGPEGTLYGTTSGGYSGVEGTVFKIQPDGSGFAVLKQFTDSIDGKRPSAGLTVSDGVLYGTTEFGGSFNGGTVFKLNTDGTGYSVLKHFFAGIPNGGSYPRAKLTLSGGVLYGTTSFDSPDCMCGSVFKLNTDGTGYTVFEQIFGPTGGVTLSGDVLYGTTMGTVFKVDTDGTGYTVLKAFDDGWHTGVTGLTQSDNTLYGTTYSGGSSNLGTVFRMNTDGTGYSVLKEFTGSDGAYPRADLIVSAGVVYGTTSEGGSDGAGTAFKLNTDGAGFAVLKHFTGLTGDGYYPAAGLALVDGLLYGTTEGGGRSDGGTVFRLNTDGSGYAVVKDFGAIVGDAIYPGGGVTLSGGLLYGTTSGGGDFGWGTVFRANTDGTGYTLLKHFPGFQGDGTEPSGALTMSDGVLWGTTGGGGSSNSGTLFRINTDGTGYQVLKEFSNSEGAHPGGGLTLSGSVLYGTTYSGGSSNAGTVFRVNTDGTGYRVLKEFSNGDGASPRGGLALLGSVLFGTTYSGGSSNAGTVFKVNTDGADFTVLKQFALSSSDGVFPIAGVILSDGILYGTTGGPGGQVSGNLFKMNTDGTGFTVLRSFGGAPGDGRYPATILAVTDGVLYGTTMTGGWSTDGTLFKINTDGTAYTVLKQFSGSDGAYPSRLTMSDGTLYGTTYAGGDLDFGTLFKLELSTPCTLNARRVGGAIILSWNNPAYSLQAAPSVTGTYTNIHGATSPYTSAIVGPQQFLRLVGSW